MEEEDAWVNKLHGQQDSKHRTVNTNTLGMKVDKAGEIARNHDDRVALHGKCNQDE